MEFEKLLKKSNKLRRKSWKRDDYIEISNDSVSFWDNEKFQWFKNYKLSLNDLLSKDWENADN